MVVKNALSQALFPWNHSINEGGIIPLIFHQFWGGDFRSWPQGSIPDAASSLAVSETQRIVLYFSELVLVMSGSEADIPGQWVNHAVKKTHN